MEKQYIVVIGREFGSGGHVIAEGLAERLGIKLYDKNIIEEIVKTSGYEKEMIEKYDEKPVNTFLSSTVRGYSNSIEENVARRVFDWLMSRAEEGDSFVVVGRCAEYVLKDFSRLISIFILGDPDAKAERTADLFQIPKPEAEQMNKRIDRKRRYYHNHFCDTKWGDARTYDLTINSSRSGVEKTIAILIEYIRARIA